MCVCACVYLCACVCVHVHDGIPSSGHTYAAGAHLAISHDYVIMRAEKGWFCFPEVKINLSFPAGYLSLMKYVQQSLTVRLQQRGYYKSIEF